MEFSGEYRVPAPASQVWDALVDPEVLQACVPGCESVEKTGERAYKASCKLRMGPVGLNMSGDLRMEDVNPPHQCRIVGEGRDRAAGHAKGEATVTITEEINQTTGAPDTVIAYTAKAVVGGRIAQLGGRLIDAAVKKYSDEFFGKFAEYLGGRKSGPTVETVTLPDEEEKKRGIQTAMVIGGTVAVLLLLLFLLT